MTLVEVLLGLALTALLLVALNAMLQVSTAAGAAASQQLDLQEQAQFAARRIVRRIESTPGTVLSPKSDVASSGDWLAPALFDLRAGSAAGTLALVETLDGATRVLAEPASSLSITAAPAGGGRAVVTVALALEKGNASASAVVSARLGGAL